MKGIFIFLVLMMSIGINVEDNVLARLNLEQNYLMVALIAITITGLIRHRHLLLITLIFFLSIGANMPADYMLNFGIDRDYFVGVLGAIVLLPFINRIIS